MEKLSGNGRVINEKKRASLVSFRLKSLILDLTQSKAWQVSLHPNYQSYVSTGGSGGVQIHKALDPDGSSPDFGKSVAKMTGGKAKFGMCIKHVSY